MKKSILVFAPVLPQPSDITPIIQSLDFLKADYNLDFVDPLMVNENIDAEPYYPQWQNYISKHLDNYDAFFGFSFGGVILQQCFSLFEQVKKTIVLFSTPSFADTSLLRKLNEVICLSQKSCLKEALSRLSDFVVNPNFSKNVMSLPTSTSHGLTAQKRQDTAFKPREIEKYEIDISIQNPEDCAKRLILGLQHVLNTDSRKVLQGTKVEYFHFIGEYSQLVNRENVIEPKYGELFIAPESGMRVLQDNLSYCKKILLEKL